MPQYAAYRQHMKRRCLSPGSIDARLSVLRRCQAAIGVPLAEATTEQICTWLDGKQVCPRTRYCYISHLAAYYSWMIKEGHLDLDPTARIDRPKLRLGVPRPLRSEDVMFAIGTAPTPQLRAMFVLAAYAGLRCMEIAGLDGSDLVFVDDDPSIVVSCGKGQKSRVVPVGSEVVKALERCGAPAHGPVFRRDGQPIPAWKVSQMIRSHLHDCGIRASAHQLRHTYATRLLRASGGDLRMTQQLLGHSSPTTTAIYAQWDQGRASVAVTRLYGEEAA